MGRNRQRRLRKSGGGHGRDIRRMCGQYQGGNDGQCWDWFRPHQRRTGTDHWVSNGEVTVKSHVREAEGVKPVWRRFWETGTGGSSHSRQLLLINVVIKGSREMG